MINDIDLGDLRRLDLNLLPVMAALLLERSTTRAAERLGLGQPAVSAALARLREVFDDPLFVRVPRGMEPTDRALELGALLTSALGSIRDALRPRDAFEPATARVTLRLGMPDNHEHFLLPALLARVQEQAPLARMMVQRSSGHSASEQLDRGEIDLACGRIDRVPAWQRREALARVGYRCLYDSRRLGTRGRLTLARYVSVPHLLVSAGGDFTGVVDQALTKLGKSRRVVLATASFAVIPLLLRELAAVATLPEHAAYRFAKDYRLASVPPPIELTPYETALAWQARNDTDPMHVWLRRLVSDTVRALHTQAGGRSLAAAQAP